MLIVPSMSDSNDSVPSDSEESLGLQNMLDAAREAVAILCEIEPDEVAMMPENRIAFSSEDSSSSIYFSPAIDDDCEAAYTFETILLMDVKEQPLIYTLLNDINKDLLYGTVYYEDGGIYLYHRMVTDDPAPSPIMAVLTYLSDLANHYDDLLKSRLGGRRLCETEEDEIEV